MEATTEVRIRHAISKDGTLIAHERQGEGPALILVDGALCSRAFRDAAASIPNARVAELPGQTHNVDPKVLVPWVVDFFRGGAR